MKHKAFLLLIFIVFSCNDIKEETKIEISRDVKLSKQIVDNDLNTSYKVPIDWKEMPVANSEKIVGRLNINGESQLIVYIPHTFFYDMEKKSLLRVGEIKFKNISKALSINTYIELFKVYNHNTEIKKLSLDSGVEVTGFKVTKNNLLTFKYLFMNNANKIIEFDYSIRSNKLSEEYPKIKASIKSFELK